MGLLTDPSAGQSKTIKLLIRYYSKLCVILYFGGVIGFCSLAYRPFNAETYFSENALLPGLVRSEYRDGKTPYIYHQELLDEMEKYDNEIPYSWILAKFRQIGLDAYTHNYTLNYPLGKPQNFTGKNVYGIMRAARASSTESVVLSVPYRSPLSVHETTAPSISIMLAFAKFANREKYWAKDIIFLVTEHEQLGMQAWLEAYHGLSCGKQGTLDSGDMRGRAGAIQAAINLELHALEMGEVDIKIEGLNGQLPNLDLFNLVSRMCIKEGLAHTFKGKPARKFQDPLKDWKYTFKTLMSMATTQATGVPNGNHGLFYRFGIQALTLEGSAGIIRNKVSFVTIGRILEGTFRSLNNLLERFHQSFFFYLLPATDRYISIGLYMPTIIAIAGTLFVKAYAKWCELDKDEDEEDDDDCEIECKCDQEDSVPPDVPAIKKMRSREECKQILNEAKDEPIEDPEFNYVNICSVFLVTHMSGFAIKELPQYFVKIGSEYGYTTESSVYIGLGICSLLMIIIPTGLKKPNYSTMIVMDIFALLEFGNMLVCLAMYNISLAMFCGVVYVPFALVLFPTRSRLCSIVEKTFWVLLHPFILVTLVVFIYTSIIFYNEPAEVILFRAIDATQHAILFSIVDSMVYGNWLFGVTCTIFTSNWICFWYMSLYTPTLEEMKEQEDRLKKKKIK